MRMALMSLAALFGMAKPLDIATLPVPSTATPVASPEAADKAALHALAADVARGAFTITGERYFHVTGAAPWVAFVKQVDNFARERKATRLDLPGADAGAKLVEAWQGSGGKGVAIAMIRRTNAGAGTLAYFDIAVKS